MNVVGDVKESGQVLERAEAGILEYLEEAKSDKRIDEQLYDVAKKQTFPNLKKWLEDENIDNISPRLKEGIRNAVENGQWKDIVNAYRQSVRFGTGGIRGMMAFDKKSIVRLKDEGLNVPILKGPNTINDLVFLLTSVGVARFGKDQQTPFEKVVIGYDSRIRGHDLAALVAQLFLAYDYTVYFFDSPCPYPEVTFAIPHELIKADVGILISASHNDYRYNGYKLSCGNGSQFDPEERDNMYVKYIAHSEPEQIRLCPFKDAADGKLWFLGGQEPVSGYDYAGREGNIINIHKRHRDHVKSFLLTTDLAQQQSKNPLKIAYCAFHGAGNVAVPRLLREVGFSYIKEITHNHLNELNGLFPSFCSEPGREQQPDPGDPRAAKIAVEAFKKQFGDKGEEEFEQIDILIGTDPDADRCGVVVKVPQNQRHLHDDREYYLLPADDMWALVLWYRLHKKKDDLDKKFITLSHTTSDSITHLARKHGLGVVRTWVGFASLAAATRDVWNNKEDEIIDLVNGKNKTTYKDLCHPFVCDCQGMEGGNRSINVGAMEQSNGFSILGGPPPDGHSLGAGGHVRDKDGTFAALLIAEIAAWARQNKTSLIEMLDEKIYLDSEIGLFVNLYEPDPLDGEYPGIEGDRLKKAILLRALENFKNVEKGRRLEIGRYPVKSACIYRTGKYDAIYPPTKEFQFPDEGVRFFFDEKKLQHVTVRPSGTGNSLRFHIQLCDKSVTKQNLIEKKGQLLSKGKAIMNGIRELLEAPRS
ncbi:MAG: hypothetical protein JW837_07620 [Sedimentisphaerales bacterium]|nr:hypothetical protein [Sedimentisphaerales bacterium]